VNRVIKFREPFRPFAPSVMKEHYQNYFDLDHAAAYMIEICSVKEEKQSVIPAVTHIDKTARPQVVEKNTNARFWSLLNAFNQLTGIPVLLNTSFNVKGEPIVCSPEDAIKCYLNSGIDILVMGNYMTRKDSLK